MRLRIDSPKERKGRGTNREPQQQARFSHTTITHHKDFEKVIAVNMISVS